MSPQPELHDETQENSTDLSRRKLLKIATAAGIGASAALFLPGKWMKPVAEVGVLPAHAQVSAILHTFVSASAQYVFPNGNDQKAVQPGDYIEATCTITPADANIPIVAKWQNKDGSWIYDTQTANTIAGGILTVQSTLPNTDDAHPRPSCQTGPVTIDVVFAFASQSQGTGTISANALFDPPC